MKATHTPDIPFVGRADELDLLTDHWRAARDGRTTLVLLRGEAGIGKTRLAYEFGARLQAQEGRFAAGCAASGNSSTPHGPVTQAVRALLGITGVAHEDTRLDGIFARHSLDRNTFGHLRDLLLGVTEPSLHDDFGGFRRRTLFRGFQRLLESTADAPPVCLFLDDLQGARVSTLDLIDYLLTQGTAGLLLLGACRDEEIALGRAGDRHPLPGYLDDWGPRATQMPLSRLQPADVEDLARQVVLPVSFEAGALHAETEGVPLLIAEYLQAVRQGRGEEAPQVVRRVLAHRLDRLGPDDRSLLRCAAVAGSPFDADLLSAMAGSPPAHAMLALERTAQVHRIVCSDAPECYRFSHAKFAEALRAELPNALRQILARTAAEHLDGTSDADSFRLAALYAQGQAPAQAALHASRAARCALAQGARREAEEQAMNAAEHLGGHHEAPAPLLLEACQNVGDVLRTLGQHRSLAVQCYERALTLTDDPSQTAQLHCWLSDLHPSSTQSGAEQRRRHLRAARRAIGRQLDCLAMARVLRRESRGDDARRTIRGCSEAVDLFERHAPDDPELFSCYRELCVCLAQVGDSSGLSKRLRALRIWTERHDDPLWRWLLCDTLAQVSHHGGRLHEWHTELEQGVRFAKELDDSTHLLSLYHHLLVACATMGDRAGFLHHLGEHRRLCEAQGQPLSARQLLPQAQWAAQANWHELAAASFERAFTADQELGPGYHALTDAYHYVAFAERAFRLSGRAADFPQLLQGFIERSRAAGAEVDGCWQAAARAPCLEDWHPGGVDGWPDALDDSWRWEDPYGVCACEQGLTELTVSVRGILGFNQFTGPRLCRAEQGSFAVEVEVEPVDHVDESRAACLDRIRARQEQVEDPVVGAGGVLVHDGSGNGIRLMAHAQAPGDVFLQTRRGQVCRIHGRGQQASGRLRLRLERTGDRFTAYYRSLEGPWRTCGQAEIDLGHSVWVGVTAEMPVPLYHLAPEARARFGPLQVQRPACIAADAASRGRALAALTRLASMEAGAAELERGVVRALGEVFGARHVGLWRREEGWVVDADGLEAQGETATIASAPALRSEAVCVVSRDARRVDLRLTAVDVLRLECAEPFGASDLQLLEQLAKVARTLLSERRLQEAHLRRQLRPLEQPPQASGFAGIIGRSEPMQRLFRDLERIAASSAPVLIHGESGTGKEVIARAIHARSPRAEAPFVVQNCAAIPENLLESELFGYRRGAFTGATADKPGLLETAHGGTVFLDEIADATPAVQAKLLRAVEEGEVRRVGDTGSRAIDVRFLSASSRATPADVGEQGLRADLYYRLAVIRVALPPLRERRDDIPLLAESFLARVCQRDGKPTPGFTRGALEALCLHDWPGNVRELINEVERCVTLAAPGIPIDIEDLSPSVRGEATAAVACLEEQGSLPQLVEHIERVAIARALERCAGNAKQAATELGLSRSGFYKKLRRYGLR